MSSGRRHRRSQRDVKDRLIQTRVPERLEHVLKEEAQKRRLTVSHLIRNMLEDTLQLVDTVVSGAGGIVGDSVDLAEHVVRDAGKLASSARDAVRSRDSAPRTRAKAPDGESASRTAHSRGDEKPARDAKRSRHDGRAHDGTRTYHDGPARDGTRRDGPAHDGTRTHHDGPARDGTRRDGPAHDGTRTHRDGPAHDGTRGDEPARRGVSGGRGRAARLAQMDHVLAWNQVVVNRPARCNGCERELPRGSTAHLGMSQDPAKLPSWLCSDCLENL
jgi:hypothetical protein